MTLLTVADLHVRIGQLPILKGVSLEVPEHGIVAVLGSNGVGKTTLMRALSGVYQTASGSIVFDGKPIANLASHKIVKLGLCQAPEGRQIFSAMTVRENLILGAQGAGDMLDHVLELFPILKERLGQKGGTLSGGEQQMLCIGRALMGRPRLLLLDEPSLGLAPKIVAQIFALVQRIRAEGTAVLLVEQNARAALAIADHAYVMEGGKVVAHGAAAELAADERVRDAYLGGRALSKEHP